LTTYKNTSNAKKGGLFVGKSHKEGGIPAIVTDTGQPIEVEGGEAIINKEATKKFWKELSEINQSAGNGVPIPPPSDFDQTIEKMEKGGVVSIAEKKQIYDKWKNLVNMSASQLEQYANSKDGKESGLSIEEAKELGISSGQESAQWIIKMKRTNWKKWTPEMWKWANKQISFISRMRGVKGDLINEKKRRTPKFKALLIWGHNPRTFKGEDLFAKGGAIGGNFQNDLEKNLELDGWKVNYYNDNVDVVPKETATQMSVYRLEPYYENYSLNIPKNKEVTFEWVMNKINTDTVYKSFVDKFEKLLTKKEIKGVNAYPTTYGIGIFLLSKKNTETIDKINQLLTDLGIKYKNEYSDAGYVYRYVISKSKENIDRMEKMELNEQVEAPEEISEDRLKELYAKYDFDKFSKGGTTSTYKEQYNQKYGYPENESHSLEEISSDTGVSMKGLQAIYNKGIGAFKTNPESVRPNVTSKEQWAMARVYSAVMGGAASSVDANELKFAKGGTTNQLLAPNGEPSNLNATQYELVRTPEFKAWFGDWEKLILTKINDSGIDDISLKRLEDTVSKVIDKNGEPLVVWHTTDKDFSIFDIKKSKEGFFFSPQKERLDVYNKSKLNSFFLNIKNPSHELFQTNINTLKPKNYDGIMDYGHAKKINESLYEIIAFYPEQIKLADGTNTTFDNSNPDIRFEQGGTTTKLLAPNGKPSNLNATQYELVRTPEFKAWFGDWENYSENASKVVDENGEPLVVWRGEAKDFNVFDYKKLGSSLKTAWRNAGFYFSPTKMGAEQYMYFLQSGILKQFFLNIRNPYTLDSNEFYGVMDWGSLPTQRFKNNKSATEFAMNRINEIKSENHDGSFVTILKDDNVVEIIAFNPEQIKLADGTNTTFDNTNPDIRFEQGGSIDKKDQVTMDIPLLTRTLELAREDIKSDEDLHHVIENLIDLKDKSVLTMDDYQNIAKLPDSTTKYAKGGEIKNMYIHKFNPDITLEVIENTNNGIKGIQKNPKSLSKKERTDGIVVNYSNSELKELFSKTTSETSISESELNKNDSLRTFMESQVSSGMLSSDTDFSSYSDIDNLRREILNLIRIDEASNEYSIPYSFEKYKEYKSRAYETLKKPTPAPEETTENKDPETMKDIKNTTSTPSVSRWDQVPVRWRNISAIKPLTFAVNPYDANFLKIVDKYLGDDVLRPVMTAIHFDEHGATVTDAHKLLHIAQKNSEFKGNYPTPVSFKIDKFTKKEDLEKQISETKYPNYLAVVPQETNYTFEVDPFKLLQYCKVAMEYSNKSTKGVSLKFGENKAIGFRANFLIEILESMMRMQKTDKIYAHITSETYAVIFTFTKEYSKTDSTYVLVMPFILNDTSFQSKKQTEISMYYGARDLDRNIELSCYYDFTDNEIHNADGSVAVYRQNYGDTADLPASIITTFNKFIKKNNRIAILDNFCVDSIGVRVDNLDSSIIYKNEYGLPNGIYYIQNGATVLYPNFDVDEYPRRMGLTPDKKLFTISTNAFKFYLEKCFISLGEDDLRPITSSTHIKYDLMEMKMVSTDSHMLSHFTLTEFLTEKPEKSFNLNLAQSKEFILFLSNVTSDTLTLYADNENYEIIAGESKFLSRIEKGNYPNFEAIITNHTDKELSFNFKDIYTCMNNEIIKSFAKNIDVNIKNLTISNHGNKIISSNGKYDNQTKEYNILNEKEICETEILVKEDFNDPRTFKNFVLIMPVMGTNGVNFNFAYGILNRAISIIGKDYVNMFYTELNKAYYVTSDNLNYKTSDVYKPVKQLKTKSKVIDSDAPQFVEGELVEVTQGNDKMIKSLVGKKFLIHKAYWNMKKYPNQWVYALNTGASNMPIAETNEIKKTTGEPDVIEVKKPTPAPSPETMPNNLELNVKKYYLATYPEDKKEGSYLNPKITFNDLYNALKSGADIYKVLGRADSIIRERCFEKLAEILGKKYDYVYYLWLGRDEDGKPTPAPEPTPAKNEKADYMSALDGAKALLKYADSPKEKADIQSYIKGLEVMLK
jgi:hypothetical protein